MRTRHLPHHGANQPKKWFGLASRKNGQGLASPKSGRDIKTCRGQNMGTHEKFLEVQESILKGSQVASKARRKLHFLVCRVGKKKLKKDPASQPEKAERPRVPLRKPIWPRGAGLATPRKPIWHRGWGESLQKMRRARRKRPHQKCHQN